MILYENFANQKSDGTRQQGPGMLPGRIAGLRFGCLVGLNDLMADSQYFPGVE